MAENVEGGPIHILDLGFAFFRSKTLLTAVELGVFSELAKGPVSYETLRERLGLHPRSARDFFDALVASRLLEREGHTYSNSRDANVFLDRAKPTYIGGMLEMANERLYGFWAHLTDGLRTGEPQNEARSGQDFFGELYKDPARLREFLSAMDAAAPIIGKAAAHIIPWDTRRTFVDVGGAKGSVAVQIALAHEHLTGGTFDLPPVQPIFDEHVARFGLTDRLRFYPGDFFIDPLPTADVLIMGHVLHDWDLDQKCMLIKKAYDALPPGGALMVYDAMLDEDRKENAFGLLMSLNMLIETVGGFEYTPSECCTWMREAGFSETTVDRFAGPDSVVVAIK